MKFNNHLLAGVGLKLPQICYVIYDGDPNLCTVTALSSGIACKGSFACDMSRNSLWHGPTIISKKLKCGCIYLQLEHFFVPRKETQQTHLSRSKSSNARFLSNS